MGFLSMFRLSRGHAHAVKSTHTTSYQSLPPALFPTSEYTASVSAWASSIQDLAENQECRLRRVVHCKAKSGSRQEFLLIYVRHPSGKDAIVLADRDTSSEPSPAYVDDDKPPPYSQGTIEMDMRALGTAPSHDCIRLSSDGTEASLKHHIPTGWDEIHTVKFPKASEAPSVAHLAVLLTVLHQHVFSPRTSVEARSGWFAYCVAEVIKEIFGGKVKPNKSWVRVPYGGMNVDSGRDTVGALIREFKPAWENFSRRRMRGGRTTEYKSKRQEESKAHFLVDMLRTIWNPI